MIVLAALFSIDAWVKPWSKYQELKGRLKDVLELVGVAAFGVAVIGFPSWVLGKLLTADAARLFLKHVHKLVDWLFECRRNASS